MGVSEKVEPGGQAGRTWPEVGQRPSDSPPTAAERRRVAVEIVRDHEALLRASARRVSICADDAEDAVQRGIEILLSKAPTADAGRLLPWARTVVRNEALAIRRSRERILARPAPDRDGDGGERDRDWIADLPSGSEGPSELVVRRERVERGREALALLKPQELKALTQLAHGYSYAEIGAINGWTRTKVNRCLAEGRARLRSVVRESESGRRCDLIAPLISACADGELGPDEATAVRNHLAVCGPCRAMLREYRAIPSRVAALAPAVPIALEVAPEGSSGHLFDWAEGLVAAVWTRAGALLPSSEAGLGATLASGGMRGAGAAALAKLAAVCVGTAGGAAACVAAGILPSPIERPEKQPPAGAIERQVDQSEPTPVTVPAAVVSPETETARPDPPSERPDRRPGQPDTPAAPAAPEPPEPVAAEFDPGAPPPSALPSAAPAPSSPRPAPPPPPATSGRIPSGEFQP